MAQVANCPNCLGPVSVDDMLSDPSKLAYAASQLVGAVFIVDLMMHHPEYAAAVEGFNSRLTEMTNTMIEWVHDIHDWGNAYDPSED